MNESMKVGWVTLIGLAVLAMVMFFTAIIRADVPTLEQRIAAVVPSLASKKDAPVDAAELASAIVAVPHVTREWAALLLTVAGHESALSARIAANNCRGKECDHGKAFGLYQGHKNKLNEDVWGSADIRVQTLEASRALRSAFYMCGNGKRRPRPDWVPRTINCYAGRSPDAAWPGLDTRLKTYSRIVGRL